MILSGNSWRFDSSEGIEQRGYGDRYEFKNRKGDVSAFTEERYVRHRVIVLRAAERTPKKRRAE